MFVHSEALRVVVQFKISVKFCVVLISLLNFYEEKVFRSYLHFYETLKPNSQELAQNFEKKCL
jgi:hypothetical protein